MRFILISLERSYFLQVINVKIRVYIQVLQTHTSKTAKIGTVNLVVEHVVTTAKCSATKFTVTIFVVFDV